MEKKITEVTFNDTVDILLNGAIYDPINDTEDQQALRLEDDRTLRTHSLAIGTDALGEEFTALIEDDRTPRSQMVLWETATPGPIRWRGEDAAGEATVSLYGTNVSGAVTPIENEDTGELRVVSLGADEAGNLDRLRTDPDRNLWVRKYEAWVTVDPLDIGNGGVANNLLFNPGPDAFGQYEIDYMITNTNGAMVTVTVGVDIGGTGVVDFPWMDSEDIPFPGSSGWRSGGIINEDDDVRGVASAAGAIIHWRIKRTDQGI